MVVTVYLSYCDDLGNLRVGDNWYEAGYWEKPQKKIFTDVTRNLCQDAPLLLLNLRVQSGTI